MNLAGTGGFATKASNSMVVFGLNFICLLQKHIPLAIQMNELTLHSLNVAY